ncbi:MAG: helix-turn-helix domain-containing protein [Oceanococcus sp.]
MNQDDFEQPQHAAVSNLPLPGQLVRQAREQRGLSLRELSEKTRLTENVLTAIERDDFRAMGEPVYARGYYRKCAEALSLNAGALVEAYEQHSGTASPVPTIEQRPSIAYREGPGKTALIIAVGLMLLVFLVCALWLWSEERDLETLEHSPITDRQEQLPSDQPPQALVPVATATPELEQAEVQRDAEFVPLEASSLPKSTASPAVPATSQSAPVAKPVQSAATATIKPAPLSGEALLRLEIAGGEAWIDIRDREGRKLLYKLLEAGNVREVQGQAPFRVSLGRADHVNLMLNGQAIDISAQLKPGLTAVFLMDASGRLYSVDTGASQ